MPETHTNPEHQDAHGGAPAIAIVGLGPRGGSLIERLGAHLSARPHSGPLELHLIDDAQAGAGRIWRTDQHRELCMNTLADAVTLFTEPGSTVTGPVREGPTLYEWCLLVRATDTAQRGAADAAVAVVPAARAAAFTAHPARAGVAADYREELDGIRPESHPSRALYGEYLVWFLDRALAELPQDVTVTVHRARAVSLSRVSGRERLTLDTGERLTVDSVILATGWLPRASTPDERRLGDAVFGRPELSRVPQGSPVDQQLDRVRPGEHTIVRGLGMGFFDSMALLTIGHGGEFVPDAEAPGGLSYRPSGREPILHVTSRRGVPFRAKSLYHSLPPQAPQELLRGVDWDSAERPIDFDRQLWPRIVGDAFLAHATVLAAERPDALAGGPAALDAIDAAVREAVARTVADRDPSTPAATVDAIAAAVAPHIPDRADRFDLAGELDPTARGFDSPEQYEAWIRERVIADLAEAELGRAGALKAGLWSISSARAVAARIGTHGGFDAESCRSGFPLLHAIGGMAGSGPPAFRNRQLLALQAAGLVRFIGPAATVTVEERGIVASSPRVAGSEVTATGIIDAWMHFHDITASNDPLTLDLLSAGRARAFRVAGREPGGDIETRGFDIDPATGLLIGSGGTVDPAVHIAGIPVDDTLHDTIISPMPGTDPTMLRETDRVAASALGIALAADASRHDDARHRTAPSH